MMASRPKLLITLPPTLYEIIFSPAADAALQAMGDVTANREERNWSASELAERIRGHDLLITGWGTPTVDAKILDAADNLRLIAHSAGSIKKLLPPPVFERGIAVTHAASAIAPAVAEITLLLILLNLRPVITSSNALKAGKEWRPLKDAGMGHELAGQRVGVIGAGYVGQCVLNLLAPFNCDVWVYDPYLTPEKANALGVTKKELNEVMAGCPIVTLHAPTLPETHHMIGAEQLALLQNDAIFINTARSWLVDQDALLAALESGRFRAALDVFDEEPLPVDSPFRELDNVILTPHIAGATTQTRRRQGDTIVAEIQRFLNGDPLRYGITSELLNTLA